MKTFIKAKADYADKLREGEFYEVVRIIKTRLTSSGKAVVILREEDFMDTYDSGFFE